MVSLIESLKTTREVTKLSLLRDEKIAVLSTETTTRTKTKKSVKQQKSPKDILIASGINEDNPMFSIMLTQMEAALKK